MIWVRFARLTEKAAPSKIYIEQAPRWFIVVSNEKTLAIGTGSVTTKRNIPI